MGNLKKLQIFDASENKIEYLPDEISGCTALTDFHLSQNLLEELPDTIGKCELKSVTNDDPYFLVARWGRGRKRRLIWMVQSKDLFLSSKSRVNSENREIPW